MKIGIFDSGVGGFTVVKELLSILPRIPLVYFGDTARTPYGPKSPTILKQYALEDARFLVERGANVIVIACHSAASCATEELRTRLNVPIFEVVTPSVEKACKLTRKGRIGIIGTRATVTSNVYPRLIPQTLSGAKVFQQPCPLLVPLVEEGWLKARETRIIVKKYLRPLKDKQIDTLVLGCTHYPLLKPVIQEKAGKRIKIVDPSREVAEKVAAFLIENDVESQKEASADHEFFVSDLTSHTPEIVRRFLGRKVELVKAVPKSLD
ncbi:MAG: glutamate racemase [Thermodesulfobacteria bacterium]|nr:glutamate racemase [Thermodesulfobacteriota bacterium]